MSQPQSIYDLGSIDVADSTRRAARTTSRPRMGEAVVMTEGVDVPGFLSMIVPGLGQLFCRQAGLGFFFLTWTALSGVLGWALVRTLDGTMSTLRVLGYPGVAAVWTLGGLYVVVAFLHLVAVLTAGPTSGYSAAHPVICGLASAFLPGAGQILAGSRIRAAVFLATIWAIAALWLLALGPVVSKLDQLGVIVPDVVRTATQPAVLWTAPAVVWALSVYDAIASATAARG
jgi:TM2 domain-containing membrane protein YozV